MLVVNATYELVDLGDGDLGMILLFLVLAGDLESHFLDGTQDVGLTNV